MSAAKKCPGCRIKPRIYPYYCMCGKVYQGPASRACKVRKPRPRTFGRVLRELAGCGCRDIPWAAWDRRGLDWCRDNADRIAKRLASEPKTGLSEGRARELVRLAIEIADRQATAGQSANQAGPSG